LGFVHLKFESVGWRWEMAELERHAAKVEQI
jgi:hypothetical protein